MKQNIPVWYKVEYAKSLVPFQGAVGRCDSAESSYEWQSSESAPAFVFKNRAFIAGWYLLEVDVTADTEYMNGAIFFDHGRGFIENKRQSLLLRNGKTRKRVVFLSGSVKRIRFDPAETNIRFTVNSLCFVKITQRFAYRVMRRKLLSYHNIEHKNSIQLWRHYSQFFNNYHKAEVSYPAWITKREPYLLKEALKQSSEEKRLITVVFALYGDSDIEPLIESLLSLQTQLYEALSVIVVLCGRFCTEKPDLTRLPSLPFGVQVMSADRFIQSYSEPEQDSYLLALPFNIQLSPYALSNFGAAIVTCAKPLVVYCDHDELNANNKRVKPVFKCDWNPDLFLSQNYFGYPVIFHSTLLQKLKNLTLDPYGAWVYRIILHTMQELSSSSVCHIPLVLMHYTSAQMSEKVQESRSELELKAVIDYCETMACSAALGASMGTHRIRYPIIPVEPMVTLIIPTRDQCEILKRAVESILTLTTYVNFEIIIIDNQSANKETLAYLNSLERYSNIRVVKYDNSFNYSAMNNLGVELASGEIIGLINNDVEVITAEWLTEMVSHVTRSEIGCVGSMLYYPNDTIQHAGVILGLGGCAGHSHKYHQRGSIGYAHRLHCVQNYSAVTAACLLVRKSVFKEVGGLDEDNLKVAFNDVDFCLKVREAGYRNLWTPWAELYHHESLSRGSDDTPAKSRRSKRETAYLKQRWNLGAEVDPYYSKFLTVIREDFTLGL